MAEEEKVLEFRLESLERAVDEINHAIKSIDQSLRMLATLEVRHSETRDALSRAFASLTKIEDRLAIIERDLPMLREARGWLIAGAASVVAAVGLAVIGLVIR